MEETEGDLVGIIAHPLSQEEVTRFVTDPSAGAISLFLGGSAGWYVSIVLSLQVAVCCIDNALSLCAGPHAYRIC